MTPMFGDLHGNVRVADDGRAEKRTHRHERIIFRGDDQRWHRHLVDHAHRAGPVVIIGGIAEAVLWRGVRFVELADGPYPPEWMERPSAGKDACLPPHTLLEVAHEVP